MQLGDQLFAQLVVHAPSAVHIILIHVIFLVRAAIRFHDGS